MENFTQQESDNRLENSGGDQQIVGRYEKWIEAMRREEKKEVFQTMREVFGAIIPESELVGMFHLPRYSITNDYAISTHKAVVAFKHTRVPAMELVSVLYDDSEPIGAVYLTFLKEGGEIKLEIRHRYLVSEKRGQGIGIDLEWRLQQFCRKHCIPTMYNEAQTSQSHIGAYTWALYGYEFANQEDCDLLHKQLKYYALEHQIKLPLDHHFFYRPIQFATAHGTDEEGAIVPIGKMFLTNKIITWHGRRDVALDSEGVRDFIEYAKKRGRSDIVKEYEASIAQNFS